MSFFPVPNVFQDITEISAPEFNQNFAAIVSALNSLQSQINTGGGGGGGGFPVTTINPVLSTADTTGATNLISLQNAVTQAIATPGGALVQLPAGVFLFNGTITITGSTGGIIIQGSSTGTQLQVASVDFFLVTGNSETNGNSGIRFRDIQFQYNAGATAGNCINANGGGADTTAEWCHFTNCPTAFNAGSDGKALHAGLLGCTVDQNRLSNTTQVILSASENFMVQSIVRQKPIVNGGPTGCTGVLVSGSPACYILDNHISDFTTGLKIGKGNNFIYVNQGSLASYTNSIVIQPEVSNGTIYSVFLSNLVCPPTHTNSGAGASGIFIDTNGGTATNVQGIYINNVQAFGWPDAGLSIGVADSVFVNGGMFANNGQAPSATALGAGISVNNAATNIKVSNVDLQGTSAFWNAGTAQPYAVALSGGCSEVEFNTCNMSGNANSLPVYTNGTINHWYVFNSRGYNRQNFVIASAAPATGQQFDGTGHGAPITQWTTPYLGPILVTWNGAATVSNVKFSHDRSTVSAVAAGPFNNGMITLNPPQSMELDYTGGPFTTFNIFGM